MSDQVIGGVGLTKRFHEGLLDVTVLQGVDLSVQKGETLAIVGASGSGKSTLLHLLGGLDAPTSGSVELLGQRLAGLNAAEQGKLRNKHLVLFTSSTTCCPSSAHWTMWPCHCGFAAWHPKKARKSQPIC